MKRVFAFISVILCVILLIPSASAYGTLPDVNEQPRHIVCDELSDMAQAYYVGDHQYNALSSLTGALDITTGYTAMQDNELFTALHDLMADAHQYHSTYSGYNAGSLAYFWASTDAVNSGSTYTMFYSDVPADTEGIKLNREHIWPKSRASFGTKKGSGGADLHHLRPAESSLNSAKSDHLFGNINGVYTVGAKEGSVNGEVCYWVNKGEDLFECKDNVKGDVARILLYVYCRWEQPNLYTDIPADQLPANDSDSTNNGIKVIESLDTLLEWCEEDPVDTWEMRRNDLIESIQGNRNVFIDYPEFAFQLFGREVPPMLTPSGRYMPLSGDADSDWEITALDVTVIQRRLALMASKPFKTMSADVDQDDSITILDATYICRYLAREPQPCAIGEEIKLK